MATNQHTVTTAFLEKVLVNLKPIPEQQNSRRHCAKSDYRGILETFEEEMLSPSAGLDEPEWIYAGAAHAALVCGDKEKAENYLHEFEKRVEKIGTHPKSIDIMRWHLGTVSYLKQEISRLQESGDTLPVPTSTMTPVCGSMSS